MKRVLTTLVCMLVLLSAATSFAQEVAPVSLASSLFLKVVEFEKNLAGGKKLSVHVIGSADLAKRLENAIGKNIGKSTLASVTSSDGLPKKVPSIVFVVDGSKVSDVVGYANSTKVLTVTNDPEIVKGGIILGLCLGNSGKSKGKPNILYNSLSSDRADCNWHPAFFKVAKEYH